MLQAALNKSRRQHPTEQQLYGHLPPMIETIKVRRAWRVGLCRRRKDELISDILLWIPLYGRAKTGRPARTYIQQFCADTGFSLEDLLGTMNDRDGWQEIRASSVMMMMMMMMMMIIATISKRLLTKCLPFRTIHSKSPNQNVWNARPVYQRFR